MSDFIKFGENQRECVILAYDEPLVGDNKYGGKQYTYGIQPIITGEDKFTATEKLHGKIQNLGVKKGDTLYIEKVKKDDVNNGFAFFKVDLPDNPVKNIQDKGIENFEKQFKEESSPLSAGFDHKDTKDMNLTLHEMMLRIEAIEKKVGL